MYLTNEDLDLMIEIEDLLNKKLVITNGIKDVYKGEEYTYFDENDEEHNLWCKYNTLIEKLCVKKDKKNKINTQRTAEKRKLNKDYARSKKEIENRLKAKARREMK